MPLLAVPRQAHCTGQEYLRHGRGPLARWAQVPPSRRLMTGASLKHLGSHPA